MTPRELVLQQALSLSLDDQAFVAQSLEEHLAMQIPHQVEEADGLSGEEFLAELDRRSARYRSGQSRSRDVDEVMRDLQQRQGM